MSILGQVGMREETTNKSQSSQAPATCALGSKQDLSPAAALQSTVIIEHAFH